MTAYIDFIEEKSRRSPKIGMTEIPQLCTALKPFQQTIVNWALRRGRAALFEGTGLGKTLQSLSWARAVANHEQGPVIVFTPLAVAEQTVDEAYKFGIEGVAYAEDTDDIISDIVVTNYERMDKFNLDNFCAVNLDESGILKSKDGATRKALTEACQHMRWKLCCTATPAPNDYTELGQHAEFLDVMTAKEMLSMYFVHEGSIRANDDASSSSDGWRLKRHAQNDFWRWLASWSVVIRHPRDIGFDATEYDLPPIKYYEKLVSAEYKPIGGQLFPFHASTLSERISVRRDTADDRIKAAVEVVNSKLNEPWLIWCNLNTEADGIEKLLPFAQQVAGRDKVEQKIERLLGFKKGAPLHLVSKPSIAGHGMNYQHCANMVFVGLTDSFEQVYQAVRRCWRFGQNKEVNVHFVVSELEGNVIANIKRKEADHDRMHEAMASHMRDLMKEELFGSKLTASSYKPKQILEIPAWL